MRPALIALIPVCAMASLSAPALASPRVVQIEMSEGNGTMAYSPTLVEARPGEVLEFRLRNGGAIEHEFVIGSKTDLEAHAAAMAAMAGHGGHQHAHGGPKAATLAPGTEATMRWTAPASGELAFACLIPGHREAGMEGVIRVK